MDTLRLSANSSAEFNCVFKSISGEEESLELSGFRNDLRDKVWAAHLAKIKHEPLEASHGARIMDIEVGVAILLLLFFFLLL